jgi:cytochrome c553
MIRIQRKQLKQVAIIIAVLVVLMTVGGFLLAASGVIPITASSKHWAITRWFLQFSKRRSVATHSMRIQVPASLGERWLVVKGAGHYEIGCRSCHGSPEMTSPRIAREMTPTPPYLPVTVPRWEAEELFYMVKHGIKFTGMPAWPSQKRDDEVWAMVAFLRAFSELDAGSYERLATGGASRTGETVPIEGLAAQPDDVPDLVTANCARCHGVDGLGRQTAAFPKLAGQSEEYMVSALEEYSQGRRHSGIMEPIAAALDSDEVLELSRYFATLPISTPASDTGAERRLSVSLPVPSSSSDRMSSWNLPSMTGDIERGEAIARYGVPSDDVPACNECHGPGPNGTRRNPAFPTLDGQPAEYLALQLLLFKEDRRGGGAYAHVMRRVAQSITTEQISDVVQYFSKAPESHGNDNATKQANIFRDGSWSLAKD